ncbi:unnamed protein product [Caenorhabditis sp. 36 PRJEB53466]|nr:unnamed protein product [Caenorhabditis sp. 36 PRJEB53466]
MDPDLLMAESSDIPTGTYTLTLGSSFDPQKGKRSDQVPGQFHTLRYDFKPSSVSNEAETYIAYGSTGDVHVSVPNEGDNMTVYKGSKKEAKPKECLLFFDKTTNSVRLEKITSNINVKKTRDLDPATEHALKKGIERLRTSTRRSPTAPAVDMTKIQHSPDSSDSSSDSDGSTGSERSNSSDDEDSQLRPSHPRILKASLNTVQRVPQKAKTGVTQKNMVWLSAKAPRKINVSITRIFYK